MLNPLTQLLRLPEIIERRQMELAKVFDKIAKVKEKAEAREVQIKHEVRQNAEQRLSEKQWEELSWKVYFEDEIAQRAEALWRRLELKRRLLEAEIERLHREFQAVSTVAANYQNLAPMLALAPEPEPPKAPARQRKRRKEALPPEPEPPKAPARQRKRRSK